MKKNLRSKCPLYYALDLIGDKWSLLILRDIILGGKKFFHEFAEADEKIATNILSNRLATLEANNIINKTKDTIDKKRFIYSPTEKGLDLLPIIIAMISFSSKHIPNITAPKDFLDMIKNDPVEFEKKVRSKFSL